MGSELKHCSIPECNNDASTASGGRAELCCAHYKKKLKYGDPCHVHIKRSEIIDWIAKHTRFAGDECLIWPFARSLQGYGYVRFDGETRLAHRVICQLAHGEPPDDASQVAHSCGKGHDGCVNQRHLRWEILQTSLSMALIAVARKAHSQR
jgi:hypothetical protein